MRPEGMLLRPLDGWLSMRSRRWSDRQLLRGTSETGILFREPIARDLMLPTMRDCQLYSSMSIAQCLPSAEKWRTTIRPHRRIKSEAGTRGKVACKIASTKRWESPTGMKLQRKAKFAQLERKIVDHLTLLKLFLKLYLLIFLSFTIFLTTTMFCYSFRLFTVDKGDHIESLSNIPPGVRISRQRKLLKTSTKQKMWCKFAISTRGQTNRDETMDLLRDVHFLVGLRFGAIMR